MEYNKLISMTEFVLQHPATTDYEYQLGNILRYAAFLSQPLKLEYFVPCDDDGNVLTEPEWSEPLSVEEQEVYEHDQYLYEKAQQKVLFKGFKVVGNDDDGIEIEMTDKNIWIIVLSTSISIQHYSGQEWEIQTVEEMFEFLKEYGLQATLSETALKQIYG